MKNTTKKYGEVTTTKGQKPLKKMPTWHYIVKGKKVILTEKIECLKELGEAGGTYAYPIDNQLVIDKLNKGEMTLQKTHFENYDHIKSTIDVGQEIVAWQEMPNIELVGRTLDVWLTAQDKEAIQNGTF